MKKKKKFKTAVNILSNVQIQSALIWAFTIIGCSYVSSKSDAFFILITAAGFHVILMARSVKQKSAVDCPTVF